MKDIRKKIDQTNIIGEQDVDKKETFIQSSLNQTPKQSAKEKKHRETQIRAENKKRKDRYKR